jgi:hypothetical protein
VVHILDGLMTDAKSLVLGAVTIMAIVSVIMTWARTRSLVPTLGAVLLGAIVLYGVNNFDFLEKRVGDDVRARSTASTTGN